MAKEENENNLFFQILLLNNGIMDDYCNSSIEATHSMMLNYTWLLWSYNGIIKQRLLRALPLEVPYSAKKDSNMYTSLVLNLAVESAMREQ